MSTPRVHLTPLAGAGQIGGSTWHVQQGRRGLLIDFGSDMKRGGSLLGARLRRRDNRGIGDALTLGLLPLYQGIYRDDLLVDPEVLDEAKSLRVEDVLVTHSHLDHAGELYALDPKIRVHMSRAAAAMQHAAGASTTGLRGEATQLVSRLPHVSEEGLIAKPRGGEALSRPFLTVDGAPSEEMRRVWRETGSDAGLGKSDLHAAGVRFRAHPVDHSCPGTCAYTLMSDQGDLVHCADFRFHGARGELSEAFVERLERRRPRVLIVEGTRLGRSGDEETTEAQCRTRIRKLVREAGKRLVIASVSPNNLERLASFLSAALDSKRRLVVSPKTLLAIESVASADPEWEGLLHDRVALYDPAMISRSSWHRGLRERHADRLVAPSEIRLDPERFVVAHTFLRTTDWIDLRPHGALFVYSASAAYDHQARGEHAALGLWTEMYSMDVEGIRFDGGSCAYDHRLNPSGHVSEAALCRIVARTRAEILIPVHCERPELFRNFAPRGTRVLLPENGRTITLS